MSKRAIVDVKLRNRPGGGGGTSNQLANTNPPANTISIFSRPNEGPLPLVIERNAVVGNTVTTASTSSSVLPSSTSHNHIVAINNNYGATSAMMSSTAMLPQLTSSGGGNNSPLMSSRNSRNSKTSYNSIASTLRIKSNRLILMNNNNASGKKAEPMLFEDPLYRAKQMKKQRKQDIQKRFNESLLMSQQVKPKPKINVKKNSNNLHDEYKMASCNMTFIFDPNGRLSYYMSFIVSLAFLYNFWVIIYRYSFNEIKPETKFYWFCFDYLADFFYLCDIAFNLRTGFLEEGVLQTDPLRLRHYYMNTTRFYIDCLCLLPLDILYLSFGYNSMFRCFRLVKIYRFWAFLDRTERHTNYPNLFRTIVMLHYLFAIFHWNACISYYISFYLSNDLMIRYPGASGNQLPYSPYPPGSQPHPSLSSHHSNNYFSYNAQQQSSGHNLFQANTYNDMGISSSKGGSGMGMYMNPMTKSSTPASTKTTSTERPSMKSAEQSVDLMREYLKAFYLSTKIMTLVSEIPNPHTSKDYIFAIVQLVMALMLFANIMGHVGYIVSNLGNARKEFQSKLDGVKTYMSLRTVPDRLQDRVIRWFDYLWSNHKSTDDNQILNLLPYKLRAEIAIHVHLDTLRRVEIFQSTEAGFLNELVLKLKPVLFSPGDFICRKGEVGKEMYIVSSGKLQVISEDGKVVLATLKAGSYFGEISILNMGASGNRRTASVKSVGYSDLFCLSKEDLWEVLKEYPAVRVKLEAIAIKRLENHKKPLTEIVNVARCKSAPGLLAASQAYMTFQKPMSRKYGSLPDTLLKRTDLEFMFSNTVMTPGGKLKRKTTAKKQTRSGGMVTATTTSVASRTATTPAAASATTPMTEKTPAAATIIPIHPPTSLNLTQKRTTPPTLTGVAGSSNNGSFNYHLPSPRNYNDSDNLIATPTSISISSFNFSINNNNNATNRSQNSTLFSTTNNTSQDEAYMTSNNFYRNYGYSEEYRVLNEMNRRAAVAAVSAAAASASADATLNDEINRLRKYIYYLETENLRLNLKIDRYLAIGGNNPTASNNNNTSGRSNLYPFEIELQCKKAVPESDSDEYKV